MVQKKKKKNRASRENPCKAYRQGDACSPSPSEFLRISDICSFPLTRLYIVLYGGRPQAVVGVSLLISKQRSWYPKVPGEATVRNTFKKGSHKMELRWWELLAPQAHGTQLFFFHHPFLTFLGRLSTHLSISFSPDIF